MISDKFKDKLMSIRANANPMTFAKSFGSALAKSASKIVKVPKLSNMLGVKNKPLIDDHKLGKVDTAFYSTVSENNRIIVRKRDSLTDITAKIYNFMRYTYDQKKMHSELDALTGHIEHEQERMRQQKVLDAIGSKKELQTHIQHTPETKKASIVKEAVKEAEKVIAKSTEKTSFLGKLAGIAKPITSTVAKVSKIAQKIPLGAAVLIGGGTLGIVSAKYESNDNPGSVSSGKNDKGGVSYGSYQLSTNSGNADKFVAQSSFKDEFKGLKAGTPEFSSKWKEIAADPSKVRQFAKEQKDYIGKTNFVPALEKAKSMGFDIENAGVANSLWSLSVQHGHVQEILDIAKKKMGDKVDPDPRIQIQSLYDARSMYVSTLKNVGNFDKRYQSESKDALELVDQKIDYGTELDDSSSKLKDVKKKSSPALINNTTTIINQPQNSTPFTVVGPRENSRPNILEEILNGG